MTAVQSTEDPAKPEILVLSDDPLQPPNSDSLEDGEITEVPGTVPTPPAKRRKCGRESLLEQARDINIPKNVLIRSTNIIWVDLEMTGLDVNKDVILEMACIVTDKHLNVLAEGPNLIVHQPDEVLNGMGEWCTQQHGKTGLTQQSRDGRLSCQQVEQKMIDFISQYCPKGRCELAGSSIHTDRKFLEKHMPLFLEWLHFRIIDVSTVRNLCWRWYSNFEKYHGDKAVSHRALDDIKSSIDELRYYRETVFKSKVQYKEDIEMMQQDAFEMMVTRCEGIQGRKIVRQRSKSESEAAADHALNRSGGVAPQKPVSVSVNGKNITLFGNQV